MGSTLRVIFLLLPDLEILDLAGPLQAFDEARRAGADLRVHLCSPQSRLRTDQGLWLAELEPLPEPASGDLIVVPGLRFAAVEAVPAPVLAWLREAHELGAQLASICTGAFVLGRAGLLKGRQCTTHWSRVEDLQRRFPSARVLESRLFVHDGPVTTSAGIASGIDMALALLDRRFGPLLVAAVAREMVVYLRRDGSHRQQSVYLDYRTQLARGLLHDPRLTVDGVAARCGFGSARQLRRLWREVYGTSPGSERAQRA